MKKKRKTALPRLTVLSYNRRDLASFVQAVENLRLLVEDLRIILEPAKRQRAAKVAAMSPPKAATE